MWISVGVETARHVLPDLTLAGSEGSLHMASRSRQDQAVAALLVQAEAEDVGASTDYQFKFFYKEEATAAPTLGAVTVTPSTPAPT